MTTTVWVTCPGPVIGDGCVTCGARASSMGTGTTHMRPMTPAPAVEEVDWRARALAAEAALAKRPAPGTPEAMAPVWALVDVVRRACGNTEGRHLSSIERALEVTVARGLADARAAAEAERDTAVTDRDQALAALAGLREAARAWDRWCSTHHGDAYLTQPSRGLKMALDDALAATPADLGARVIAEARAKALEDAAHDATGMWAAPLDANISAWLERRAAKERGR